MFWYTVFKSCLFSVPAYWTQVQKSSSCWAAPNPTLEETTDIFLPAVKECLRNPPSLSTSIYEIVQFSVINEAVSASKNSGSRTFMLFQSTNPFRHCHRGRWVCLVVLGLQSYSDLCSSRSAVAAVILSCCRLPFESLINSLIYEIYF